jgi:hypothetical protein
MTSSAAVAIILMWWSGLWFVLGILWLGLPYLGSGGLVWLAGVLVFGGIAHTLARSKDRTRVPKAGQS